MILRFGGILEGLRPSSRYRNGRRGLNIRYDVNCMKIKKSVLNHPLLTRFYLRRMDVEMQPINRMNAGGMHMANRREHYVKLFE